MRGWLIYEAENIQRNTRFISFFMDAAKGRQTALQLITTAEICWGIRSGAPFLLPAAPDFAVMRCMRPDLSRHLEKCGVAVFNSAAVSEICNDKQRTHDFFSAHGFPALDTAFVRPDCPAHPFSYPVVVKASRGCGGRQVYLCADAEEYQNRLQSISPDTAVVQPVCDTPGRDVRCYMLGGRMVQAMERYSEGDFRSNFGLNGLARPYALPDDMRAQAERAARLLRADFVGVDFIFHQGHWLLNEIEDAVGTRMLYQFTSLQIVEDYMAWILERLAGRALYPAADQ